MNRVFCLIGFSYFIMSALLFFVPEFILPYIIYSLAVAFAVLISFKKHRKEKVLPVAALVGLLSACVYLFNLNYNIKPTEKFANQDCVISGQVIDLPYKQNNNYCYILKVNSVNGTKTKPFRLKLMCSEPMEANLYDVFAGKVHTYLPQNTSSFNSRAYYRSKKIYILAYAYNHTPYKAEPCRNFNFNYYILKTRKKMLSVSKEIFSPRLANVMNGLLLGEKHEFPEDVKKDFDTIGVYHLIATSGIHLSIISSLFLKFFKKLKFGIRFSYLLGALCVFAFMALTCFSPSVTRAGIMAMLYLLGAALFKKPDSLNSLGISVFVICLFSPDASLDIGLWLSFTACLGIILLGNPINNFLKRKLKLQNSENKLLKSTLSIISTSLAVSVFSFPICAWFFKKTSLLFCVSNVFLIPPSTLLLSLLPIIQILKTLSVPRFISAPLELLCAVTTNLIIHISHMLAKIPFALISLDYGFVYLCISFSLILIAVTLLFNNYRKLIRLSALLSLIIFISAKGSHDVIFGGTTRLAVLGCQDGASLAISKSNRKIAVIYPGEYFYVENTDKYFLKLSNKNFDYLSTYFPVNESAENIKEIIIKHKPRFVILPQEKSMGAKKLKEKTKIKCFKNHVNLNLWGNIIADTFVADNHIFTLITVGITKFLISADGGDASKIPENYKTCDFFIAGGLPLNYQKIKFKHLILSMNKTDTDMIMNKSVFLNLNKKVFCTAYEGNIYVDIKKEKNYTLRRFQ